MPKPRVGILHYSCPPVIGGVEFIIEAHAREFTKAGYAVKLIVGKGGPVDPAVKTVVIPEISSRGGSLSPTLRALARGHVPGGFESAVKRVEKLLSLALRNVDICIVHNVLTMHFNLVLTAALANIMKRRRRIHFIAWTHDLTFGNPVYGLQQQRRYPWTLLMRPLPNCDYCAISGWRRDEMCQLFRTPASRIPVIPDGINVAEQLGLTPDVAGLFHGEGLSGIDLVAFTPARILRRKNLGVGMEIVSALKGLGMSVRWIVTGAPDPHNPASMEYFRTLRSLRHRLQLRREVIFLCERFEESVSSDDLRGLYRISDMLLFPSDREGFGLPVLEAGVAGLLVVISDIPALRELANKHAVYIGPGDSVDKVARRIVHAIRKRPELAYRKHVFSTYAWEAVFAERIVPAILRPGSVWKTPPAPGRGTHT